MNPFDRFGQMLVEAFPYVVVALLGAGLLWLMYLAILLGRMRGTTLEAGTLFRHPSWPLTLRYPPWWDVRIVGETVEFDSHEKDSVLRLTCQDAVAHSDDPRDLVRAALDTMKVDLDVADVRPVRVNPYPGGHASGFADRRDTEEPEPGAPPGYTKKERCFAAAWAFRGPRTLAVFAYDCSVLSGMVDGYYHDLMMPTLLLDDQVPPQPDATQATETKNSPTPTTV